MDAKSLAKSKRAHSQHLNKKHHPNPKTKSTTSSVGASSKEKAPGKAIKEKPRQSQGSAALPSNWDRYEDEYELGTETPSEGHSSQPSDIVLPRSKGADYAYLISEAKSQYSTSSSSEIFPSFDDLVTDFDQGKFSFFSVRGERIASSIQNESFLVDDKGSASREASFLSLDLDALARQLAKVDLPKRLFMEADMLPPELCAEGLQENHDSIQDQDTYDGESAEREGTGLQSKLAAGETYGEASDNTTTSHNHVHDHTAETRQFSKAGSNSMLQPTRKSIPKDEAKFRAETAEAELDLLLNSLTDDAKYTDSTGFMEISSSTTSIIQGDMLGGVSSRSIPGPQAKKSNVALDIDDTLDDLLNETAGLNLIDQTGSSLSHEVKAAPGFVSTPSFPASNSKLLDEFDSWLDTI